MAGISISDYKAHVADLARPNRFLINIVGDAISTLTPAWSDNNRYYCQSTQLPGREIGDITVNWQGMQVKLAGDPTFADIELKFQNAYDFKTRDFFEAWLDKIAAMGNNNRTAHSGPDGAQAALGYKAEVTLTQLGRNGEEIAVYVLSGAYPKNVGAVNLDMGTENTVEDFTVSFRYDVFFRQDSSGVSIP